MSRGPLLVCAGLFEITVPFASIFSTHGGIPAEADSRFTV